MENKDKQPKANLIPKPIQRAFYAGFSAGGLSFVFSVPVEFLPRIVVAGATYSLIKSWLELGPKRKSGNGRRVMLNGRTIDLEYSVSQGGYMARETWGELGKRLVFGRSEANTLVKPNIAVLRPSELDEFIFVSNGLQLRELHVKLFIKSAWRNRQYGKGLSERRWVREFSQRPAWYKELSTDWYYAVMKLLLNCQSSLGYQMITVKANGWLNLANEPFMTMRLLKWYEIERRK